MTDTTTLAELFVCALCHGVGHEAWAYTPCHKNHVANAPGQNAGHECDPLVDVIAYAYNAEAELDVLRRRVEHLTNTIRNQPHAPDCIWGLTGECDCFKREALHDA